MQVLASATVVICTYNGCKRIRPTLLHLASQSTSESISWEVVIVDNASTDQTAEVAEETWPKDSRVPMRIVRENKPGVAEARKRGLEESKSDFIIFVDDDNWLDKNWIEEAVCRMVDNPQFAAMAGYCEPVFETCEPFWFKDHFFYFAVNLSQGSTREMEGLNTAGMIVRRKAWLSLQRQGFEFLGSGGVGNKLLRSEDVELSMAFRCNGWKLCYCPDLKLKHFIPENRTTVSYLRNLYRGIGESGVVLDAYNMRKLPERPLNFIRELWMYQFIRALFKLARNPILTLMAIFAKKKYSLDIVLHEHQVGRFVGLLKSYQTYVINAKIIQQAPWVLQTSKSDLKI